MAGKANKRQEKTYCVCRKPYGGRFMICCDSCKVWFHGSCVGVKPTNEISGDWFCPKCTSPNIESVTSEGQNLKSKLLDLKNAVNSLKEMFQKKCNELMERKQEQEIKEKKLALEYKMMCSELDNLKTNYNLKCNEFMKIKQEQEEREKTLAKEYQIKCTEVDNLKKQYNFKCIEQQERENKLAKEYQLKCTEVDDPEKKYNLKCMEVIKLKGERHEKEKTSPKKSQTKCTVVDEPRKNKTDSSSCRVRRGRLSLKISLSQPVNNGAYKRYDDNDDDDFKSPPK